MIVFLHSLHSLLHVLFFGWRSTVELACIGIDTASSVVEHSVGSERGRFGRILRLG